MRKKTNQEPAIDDLIEAGTNRGFAIGFSMGVFLAVVIAAAAASLLRDHWQIL